jgi:hypothetical protein
MSREVQRVAQGDILLGRRQKEKLTHHSKSSLLSAGVGLTMESVSSVHNLATQSKRLGTTLGKRTVREPPQRSSSSNGDSGYLP